jgi:hypothetical protein
MFYRRAHSQVDRTLEADEGRQSTKQKAKDDLRGHELVAAWAHTTTMCALSALVVSLVVATIVALVSGDVPVSEVASALTAALGHWQAAKF